MSHSHDDVDRALAAAKLLKEARHHPRVYVNVLDFVAQMLAIPR